MKMNLINYILFFNTVFLINCAGTDNDINLTDTTNADADSSIINSNSPNMLDTSSAIPQITNTGIQNNPSPANSGSNPRPQSNIPYNVNTRLTGQTNSSITFRTSNIGQDTKENNIKEIKFDTNKIPFCICGEKLVLKRTVPNVNIKVSNGDLSMTAIVSKQCDSCFKKLTKESYWHCEKEYSPKHSHGFDICEKCINEANK